VVNVQLREQAEAAIKDVVATMGIDDVLSDKQPIIQELTARLRAVAEGHESDKGLGLRIVTVQIKEAVVSSGRLWENLQKPFRADRERVARLAELNAQQVIQGRELEHRQATQTAQLTTDAAVAKLRSETEAAAFDRDEGERARRDAKAQEVARQLALDQHRTQLQAAELESARVQAEAAVAKLRQLEELAREETAVKARLTLEEAATLVRQRHEQGDLANEATRQKIANDLSSNHLQAKLIAALPEVAEKLPKPTELRTVSIDGGGSGAGSLAALVAQLGAVLKGLQEPPPSP
jgi:flotillin